MKQWMRDVILALGLVTVGLGAFLVGPELVIVYVGAVLVVIGRRA